MVSFEILALTDGRRQRSRLEAQSVRRVDGPMKYLRVKAQHSVQNFWLGLLAVGLLLASPALTLAAPGDLDPTFGSGGIVITRGSSMRTLDSASAMAIQSDGKIVTVGRSNLNGATWNFAVVRYNTDGSLDTSFGGTGIVITQVGNSHDSASAVAIQADGKIVVAGSIYDIPSSPGSWRLAVVRYNTNGSLDTSFNGTGEVITSVGDSGASSVAIQLDGKIVAVSSNFTVVRYNSNGSLDSSFGGTGIVITPVEGSTNSVAIQSDGKIVAAGSSENGFSAVTVVRYNTDGTLDNSFNGTGKVVTSVGSSDSGASDLAIQPNGKIVVTAYTLDSTGGFAVVRYNPEGSLDTSFGNTGKIIIPIGNSYDQAYSVAIQPNEKIVVAGYSWINSRSDFAVVRFNPNGSLDTTFNGTGKVTTGFGGQDYAVAAAIQADGQIVVAGNTDNLAWDFYDFVVVRYQGDGASQTPLPSPTPTPNATPNPTVTPTLRANGKIAFASDRDGNREIYLMNADGTNQVRLTNNTIVDDHPTWSPDGTKIAFVSQGPSGAFGIFQMNADGTNKTEITPITFDLRFTIWDDWSMSWSPEGNRIVFQEPSAFPSNIFIVNRDGSNRHVLINGPEDEREPSWSPDGSRILFSRQVSTFFHNLYSVKPDGTDLQALEHLDGETDLASSWSPTGNMIAFRTFDYANFENIGIANADGSNRQEFDSGSINPLFGGRDKPQWCPDGSKIIFQVSRGDTEIYTKNVNGTGLTQLTNAPGNNFKPSWQPLAPAACPNPIDCADFFVRQHYLDFLNREPDDAGLAFWTNQITSCGGDVECIEVKRINVSAAFFLSIEFQETGYLAYRFHKAAFGDTTSPEVSGTVPVIRRQEFLTDSQRISQGVRVGISDWQQQLELNKNAYALDFVRRQRFRDTYPLAMSAAQFVDALNARAGGALSPSERDQLVAELAMNETDAGHAVALLKVAEDEDLRRAEFNRAFVLMQYYGYLRRNPDDPQDVDFGGWKFWLDKLNSFGGDFVQAEMVRSFLVSQEYRRRFGQP